ncbi:MAG: methionine--tRNA ligase [Euryarchaeota archaeon RBG_16_68_12]|nr:MAG: methionine--tRNA ligase [Euryarchaeota archaeon RBG_16_68_12]
MAKILVAVAWPYASGPRHIGHAVSTFVPADIFTRYHRMKGDDVLMVGGSDMHGTPTTVRADEEGVPAEAVANRFHALHEKNIEQLGVRYDLYWNTADPAHKRDVQEIFARLRERGYIDERTMTSPYCAAGSHFLPDRYVEGECPRCHSSDARGDQCESCGHLLDPFELVNPRCRVHRTAPTPRETRHAFFRLSAFQERLRAWIADKTYWRLPVLTFTRAWLDEGLQDRPITRDIDWGVEVPLPGREGKRIYVWFEAGMGYLTASREVARRRGAPDLWKEWWYDPAARHYYFIGKDNIVFHTLFWPAILMGYDEGLTLPYDVPATQFMNISGEKMSAGRGRGVWLPDLLERFSPDQVRYYATASMPELKDSEFDWADFGQRNNAELLAVYGNFVHRALTFAAKNFGNAVPAAGFLDGTDKAMLRSVEEQWKKVGQNLEYCHFRDALREAIQLARLGNVYFDQKAPWDLVRKDKAACGTAIHVALRVSRALALVMAPFTPFSSSALWVALGYDTDVHAQRWDSALEDVPAGQALRVGKPLFVRIEVEAANEADRFDVRVGRIVEVQDHPNADKLYVIKVDVGDEVRTLVAGMKANYTKDQMAGKRVAVLCNLEPAKLRSVLSNGMVLAAEDERDVGLLLPPEDATLGAQILGVRGAPRLSFSEFQTYKIRVGEGNTVDFLGKDGKTATPLAVGGKPVLVDKGFPPGSSVH